MADLPKPIAEFFRLKNAEDNQGLAQLFSEDATVIDAGERKEMRGRAEITQWIEKINLWTASADLVGGWTERDGEWVVDTVLTGNFKASPARFEYFIELSSTRLQSFALSSEGRRSGERGCDGAKDGRSPKCEPSRPSEAR